MPEPRSPVPPSSAMVGLLSTIPHRLNSMVLCLDTQYLLEDSSTRIERSVAFGHRTRSSPSVRERACFAAFLEHARPDLALAIMLALWTGQRQGDLLRLPWSAYDGKRFRLRR